MHIDDPRVPVIIKAPQRIEDLIAGKHRFRMPHEMIHEIEFLAGEGDLCLGDEEAAAAFIERKVPIVQDRFVLWLAEGPALQMLADADLQLPGRKRLAQRLPPDRCRRLSPST